jgi:hypothetical protein
MFDNTAVTRKWLWALGLLLCMAIPARAATISATVTYEEIGATEDEAGGLPVGDVFKITNTSEIGELTAVVIALGNGLLFDTDFVSNTAGTAPSFPFVSSAIDPLLVNGSIVPDGSNTLALNFLNFGPGKSYTFTIDVDRTGQATAGENRQVLGSELSGLFSTVFVGSFPDGPVTGSADFTGDGNTAGGTVTMFVVPEPHTLGLALVALSTLLASRALRPSEGQAQAGGARKLPYY